jgi:hypothetical protein
MVLEHPHGRRRFLAGGAVSLAALVGADRASAADSPDALGGVVEGRPSSGALDVSVPDLGRSCTIALAAGASAVHGRHGVVASLDAFAPGERVVFIPRGGTGGTNVEVTEISSLVESGALDVQRDGETVETAQGRFRKSANLRGAVGTGHMRATFWVDPATGERYLCATFRDRG